jgi:N-glycosylase/DNA lyase
MVMTVGAKIKKTQRGDIKRLLEEYSLRKKDIRERLRDFRKVWSSDDKRIFSELCFCICTPQSKAIYCDAAIKSLEESGTLFNGGVQEIRKSLGRVRFPNNKACYIKEARDTFSVSGKIEIKKHINTKDIPATRDFLVKSIKGIGYKEASHFLRNIGHGGDIAILDVHIMRNMIKYALIEEQPLCISRSCYFDMEEKLRCFSFKTGIPMDEMDILFWSIGTGVIFK